MPLKQVSSASVTGSVTTLVSASSGVELNSIGLTGAGIVLTGATSTIDIVIRDGGSTGPIIYQYSITNPGNTSLAMPIVDIADVAGLDVPLQVGNGLTIGITFTAARGTIRYALGYTDYTV